MKGDFTRNTFDKENHFSRVLMQQGRVQLDADWNEQAAIVLHYLRTLAADLIGPHGGPKDNIGFAVVKAKDLDEAIKDAVNKNFPSLKDDDLLITPGRYYVDGLLCENDDYKLYTNQPDWKPEAISKYPCLLYLDVWERLITYIEDDEIREVALNGTDTAVRSKIVWQVKAASLEGAVESPTCSNVQTIWDDLVKNWQPEHRGLLKARAKIPETLDDFDPCTTSPDARYRGAENQLYRVEIQRGSPGVDEEITEDNAPTFKWSRENGTVTFPIQAISGKVVAVENLGRDGRFSLKKDDWVEIVDDDTVLNGLAEPLYQVDDINIMTREVTLKTEVPDRDDEAEHPLLRRWDHKAGDAKQQGLTLSDGAALIEESNSKWLKLEDGIEIQFQASESNQKHEYCTGDYWLIPARTETGDIEWPKDDKGNPESDSPHGIEHHYAPLAIVSSAGTKPENCRREFGPVLSAQGIAVIARSESQLTSAQVNAIKKATRASSKNPFLTKADLPSNE